MLLAAVSRLQQLWPEVALFTLDDWHEHDGFVSEAKLTSWHSLQVMLTSEMAMLTLSQGDWGVRRAFFPETYDFYLRVYVPADYDNDYPERRGDFDVTCATDLVIELAEIAVESGLPIFRHDAKVFFARRYGG